MLIKVTPAGVIEAGADPWGYRQHARLVWDRRSLAVSGNSIRFKRDAAAFDRDQLRDRLHRLAARRVFIGGSSWKYEGWLDQIYSRAATRCAAASRKDSSKKPA